MTCLCSRNRRSVAPIALTITLVACGSTPEDGGSSSSSGGSATGGAATTGGAPASGSANAGGSSASGGGSSETGGTSTGGGSDGDGGALSSGGSAESGGAAAAGGSRDESGGAASGGSSGDEQPSLGCNSAALPPQSGKYTIDVDGAEREYILTLPDGQPPFTPLPLVFGFHGLMYDAEWVANGEEPLTGPYFGMMTEAQGGAIFVAPQALSGGWSNQEGRDIAFTEALVDELTRTLCVDENRIFSSGFSYGGIMTAIIGCELYETFRAVAPMSARLPTECADGLPALAYLGNHGEQDMTIPISQGEMVRESYVARNHCMSTASSADERGCVHYEGCDLGSPVEWCTFMGEHVPNPAAGPILWEFFSQF